MYICYDIIRETLNISAVGEASGNRYISDLHFDHDDMIAFDKQEVSFCGRWEIVSIFLLRR